MYLVLVLRYCNRRARLTLMSMTYRSAFCGVNCGGGDLVVAVVGDGDDAAGAGGYF
jgi:galactokinase